MKLPSRTLNGNRDGLTGIARLLAAGLVRAQARGNLVEAPVLERLDKSPETVLSVPGLTAVTGRERITHEH